MTSLANGILKWGVLGRALIHSKDISPTHNFKIVNLNNVSFLSVFTSWEVFKLGLLPFLFFKIYEADIRRNDPLSSKTTKLFLFSKETISEGFVVHTCCISRRGRRMPVDVCRQTSYDKRDEAHALFKKGLFIPAIDKYNDLLSNHLIKDRHVITSEFCASCFYGIAECYKALWDQNKDDKSFLLAKQYYLSAIQYNEKNIVPFASLFEMYYQRHQQDKKYSDNFVHIFANLSREYEDTDFSSHVEGLNKVSDQFRNFINKIWWTLDVGNKVTPKDTLFWVNMYTLYESEF